MSFYLTNAFHAFEQILFNKFAMFLLVIVDFAGRLPMIDESLSVLWPVMNLCNW